jgi:hypothetical protein
VAQARAYSFGKLRSIADPIRKLIAGKRHFCELDGLLAHSNDAQLQKIHPKYSQQKW